VGSQRLTASATARPSIALRLCSFLYVRVLARSFISESILNLKVFKWLD
jgi:hypothetical protein